MDTDVTQVKSATGAAKMRANADSAQKCALGSNGQCSFCQRTGYPILPLRYAVKPSYVPAIGAGPQSLPQMEKFSAQALKGNRYTLRVLRKGYVHVYLGVKGHWQTYAVTDDGYLRLLKNPDDPDAKGNRPLTEACKRDGHNLPASFINIPDKYKKVWIGFADLPWRKEVRAAFEVKPDARMQQVDIGQLASAPAQVPNALEITADGTSLHTYVEEYARDPSDYAKRLRYPAPVVSAEKVTTENFQWESLHGNYPRSGHLASLGEHATSYQKKTGRKMAALVLRDPVGILQELNGAVAHVVKARQDFGVAVMRPLMISQSILGLKKFFEQAAAANREAQEKKDNKPDRQYERDTESMPMVGSAGLPVYSMKATTRAERAQRDADDAWSRIAKRYDEGARAAFDQRYTETMKRFAEGIANQGHDWALWAGHEAWRMHFQDYVTNYISDYKDLVEMSALCLAGGTGEDEYSQALWMRWFSAKPDDVTNPVFRGLFGGRKELLAFLIPEKPSLWQEDNELNKTDKLYETAKGITASEEVEGPKKLEHFIDDRVKNWAASLMTTIGAISARIDAKLSPVASLTVNRAIQASQYLYSGISMTFVRVRMTVGDYLKLLNELGVKVRNDTRKQVNSLLLAGFLSISGIGNAKIRDRVVDVTIWTIEKASAIKTAVTNAAKSAAGASTAALSKLSLQAAMVSDEVMKDLRSLAGKVELSTQQARMLARDLMARNLKLGAIGEPALAAGSLYFQLWAWKDSMKAVKEKLGPDGTEAQLSLLSAGIGVFAAFTEVLGGVFKVFSAKMLGKVLIRWAGIIGMLSATTDAVQALAASVRTYKKGDTTASAFYGLATVTFALGVVASGFAIGTPALFGGLLGLGPVGWVILLVGVGIFFMWMALNAESTPAELWADRCYFGRNLNGKGLWTDAQMDQEIQELNTIVSGLRVELGSRNFSTRWFGDNQFQDDNVQLKITFGMFSTESSAYEWIWYARHKTKGKIELKRGQFGKIPRSLTTSTLIPLAALSDGDLPRVHPGPDNSPHLVNMYAALNSGKYEETTVVVNFWPDAANSEDCLAGTLVTEEV
ncbi:T6SS effector BTH_I2691 family protein [Herbaspirillum huttiense]|uniref:T6SS effector BTH_I2691 family protein n=1 Tax=Herbaspirillum huttiense TaxID=863372 RepID=UPI0031E1CA8D